MNRIVSGIPGLDKLIEGGFPEASTILLVGPPGTGKTIFGLQYLFNGAVEAGESGVLIQLGEFPKSLYWYAEEFSWDLAELQQKKLLSIYSFDPKDYYSFSPKTLKTEILSKLKQLITNLGVKRIVVDSITPLRVSIEQEAEYETSMYYMMNFFQEMNVTSLMIAEEDDMEQYSKEAHIADGVIHVDFEESKKEKNISGGGEMVKRLRVEKMEATNFPMAWFPVTINPKTGFSVRPFL